MFRVTVLFCFTFRVIKQMFWPAPLLSHVLSSAKKISRKATKMVQQSAETRLEAPGRRCGNGGGPLKESKMENTHQAPVDFSIKSEVWERTGKLFRFRFVSCVRSCVRARVMIPLVRLFWSLCSRPSPSVLPARRLDFRRRARFSPLAFLPQTSLSHEVWSYWYSMLLG